MGRFAGIWGGLRGAVGLSLGLAVGAGALWGCEPSDGPALRGIEDSGEGPSSPSATGNILVERVLDGDTMVLLAGQSARAPDGQALDGARVRLIGVDTPELGRETEPPACFANEAWAFTKEAVEGRLVRLEYDFENGLRDNFGRILGYVRVEGMVLNEVLVAQGYARVFRQFFFRDRSAYLALEESARAMRVGLWGSCP